MTDDMFSHYDTIPARDGRTDDRFVIVMHTSKIRVL